MTLLVTGAAGFVGFHVTQALLARGEQVIGIDNLNGYYNPQLKQARLALLEAQPQFSFCRCDLGQPENLQELQKKALNVEGIFHFAAQAGVRYSLKDPYVFADSNVRGHVAMLEFARELPNLKHFVYASSSSVYGRNRKLPFSETDPVDHPGSFYAVTKRAAELASSAYSHLYNIPQTGLRFFTVYGPWGRPDMAYYSFARAIVEGRDVTLYEGASLARDFTYIDDVVAAVLAVYEQVPPATEPRVLNIGNHRPEPVKYLVELLEQALGRKAAIRYLPRPESDVEKTWADITAIQQLTGWAPQTTLEEGIPEFTRWFQSCGHNFS